MERDERRVRVGVGAVVFRGAEVLLIRRGKPPFLGQWSIPGGGVEFGERLEAAALREVREETSVEARVTALIGVFEAVPGAPPNAVSDPHVVMVDYLAEWTRGEPEAGDDALDAEFVGVETALARLNWDETRRALNMALDLRRGRRSGG